MRKKSTQWTSLTVRRWGETEVRVAPGLLIAFLFLLFARFHRNSRFSNGLHHSTLSDAPRREEGRKEGRKGGGKEGRKEGRGGRKEGGRREDEGGTGKREEGTGG